MPDDPPEIGEDDYLPPYPDHYDFYGQVVGNHKWVQFAQLYSAIGRERGFLSEADRKFLLETHSLNLSNSAQRNERSRVRNRIVSAYFDTLLLQFLSPRDRQLIFKNIRKDSNGLEFRMVFKEFIRFSYLGAIENEEYDVNLLGLIKTAIEEAEEEFALQQGKRASIKANVSVSRSQKSDIETLERRFTLHRKLTVDELNTLVRSDHADEEETINAADVDVVDAIYYDARQPWSGGSFGSYTDEVDRKEATEIVSWLRDICGEYDIETREQLEESIARLNNLEPDLGEELWAKLNRLVEVAPRFDEQIAEVSDLPDRDASLLNDIIWNPDNTDIETILQQEARPRVAEPDWDPAEDEGFQKFVARIEAARQSGKGIPRGGEEAQTRWEEVRLLVDFDETEWSGYMQEKQIEYCLADIREFVEIKDVDEGKLIELDSWSTFLETDMEIERDFRELEYLYSDQTLQEAWEQYIAELSSPSSS